MSTPGWGSARGGGVADLGVGNVALRGAGRREREVVDLAVVDEGVGRVAHPDLELRPGLDGGRDDVRLAHVAVHARLLPGAAGEVLDAVEAVGEVGNGDRSPPRLGALQEADLDVAGVVGCGHELPGEAPVVPMAGVHVADRDAVL